MTSSSLSGTSLHQAYAVDESMMEPRRVRRPSFQRELKQSLHASGFPSARDQSPEGNLPQIRPTARKTGAQRSPQVSAKGQVLKSAELLSVASIPKASQAETNASGTNNCTEQEPLSTIGDQLQEVNIVVLGCSRVGKSTFVQHALDLKHGANLAVSSKRVSLEGSISIVRLIEVDTANISIENGSLRWPEHVGNYVLPTINGVLLLFNVMDFQTIEHFPQLLSLLKRDNMPIVLVASKCDIPPRGWRVTAKTIDGLTRDHKDVESFQTALCTPETHKRCVSIMLRNIILQKQGESCSSTCLGRPRASTTIQPQSPPRAASFAARNNHARAASEILPHMPCDSPSKSVRASAPILRPKATAEPRLSIKEPCSSSHISILEGAFTQEIDDQNAVKEPPRSQSGDVDSSLPNERQIQAKLSLARSNTVKDEPGDHGLTFKDLTDRFFAMPMSKQDAKFIGMFLCLYRKFSTPRQLLLEFVQRFEDVDKHGIPDLQKLAIRLRYLNILQRWISEYTCDFAQAIIHQQMVDFVATLGVEPQFAVANLELSSYLEFVGNDDDDNTESSYSDQGRSRASTLESFLSTSSTHSATSTVTAESSAEDSIDPVSLSKSHSGPSTRHSATPSMDSVSEPISGQSTGSMHPIPGTVDDARHQAQFLRPFPRYSFDKVRWHQLMSISEDNIALELTRIDWILYSSIRPRDLIRHVSLGSEAKGRCKSLRYVNDMINHFNHVAFWVANMTLIRDKPKHRASMMEKFLAVAWKLRYLNNYNSLGAVIAGINGTAVHRLSQTRGLVSTEMRKQFMRLEILMGTAKSHSAYRLAWQNTTGPRIPFLPLHRRDLVSSEAGNKTFISTSEGERINWKKFELMGDVIAGIKESQSLPYPTMKKNEDISRLILGGRFAMDEDELYERSVQLEGQDASEIGRKKFSIFQR